MLIDYRTSCFGTAADADDPEDVQRIDNIQPQLVKCSTFVSAQRVGPISMSIAEHDGRLKIPRRASALPQDRIHQCEIDVLGRAATGNLNSNTMTPNFSWKA